MDMRAGGMAKVVECLLRQHEALSSNPSPKWIWTRYIKIKRQKARNMGWT
jgi:hypothetical protein